MSLASPELLYHPIATLGLQCAASALALGLRNDTSSSARWLKILTTPIHVGCAALVVLKGQEYMRTSWAAWIAGFSLSTALRCLGECFLKEQPAEQGKRPPEKQTEKTPGMKSKSQQHSTIRWLVKSFSSLMDFRHLNSPDEAKNTPRFSSKGPNYVSTRRQFLLNTVFETILSYLVVDLLTGSPLPPTASNDFAPERMHFFRRIESVTLPEIGLRFMLPVTVFAVGAALMKLGHNLFAFAAVGSGISSPKSWRPQFGSIMDAFSLRRFWGQVWHQNLRITFTAWSDYIAHNVLCLPRSSSSQAMRLFARYTKLSLAFGVSGLLHLLVEVASGVPITKARPTVFFLYQALGIMIEDGVQECFDRFQSDNKADAKAAPGWWARLVGYAWVWSFMAWSIPWWIYPPTHYYAVQGQVPRSLVPYSVVRRTWT